MKEIDELKTENSELKKQVSSALDKLDDLESYSRRDSILISGPGVPMESQNEDSGTVVRDLIKSKLNIDLTTADINIAHRVGKRTTGSPSKRTIIVKLCRRDVKTDLRKACKNQGKSDPTKIFLNESLTPRRSTLFYTLRKIRSGHPAIVRGCTTQDGSIIAYTKSSSENSRDIRHVLNTQAALKQFCSTYIKVPLEAFLDSAQ